MPPKKGVELAPVAEAPDQPPSFAVETFVDGLLMMAKRRELAALEEGVAAACGMADDFRINLRSGVVVDFTVECVLFASQHGFSARKTSVLVKWMTDLRTCVETTGDIEKAKSMFRSHMLANAERSALASTVPSMPTDDTDPIAKGAGKPMVAKPPAKPSKGGAATEAAAEARPDARNDFASVALTLADMGHVADFVVTGVLQHWRLYHHVANAEIASSQTAVYRLAVQTPMAAPALSRFLAADAFEAQREAQRVKADEELAGLLREEAERLAAERADRDRRETDARLAEEEARANLLYFEKQGTGKAVALVHDDVQADLNQKQASVMARLARLEELLQLQGSA
jgi:uncharacterized membrane protein